MGVWRHLNAVVAAAVAKNMFSKCWTGVVPIVEFCAPMASNFPVMPIDAAVRFLLDGHVGHDVDAGVLFNFFRDCLHHLCGATYGVVGLILVDIFLGDPVDIREANPCGL